MIYLSQFRFPDAELETDLLFSLKMTCYDTVYPYGILSRHHLSQIDFEPVTIFYGGNGCGKTTALNAIAEKLQLERSTLYNRSSFFERYLEDCQSECSRDLPKGSCVITSDDVFDFMLNLRCINEGIDKRREELMEDYTDMKYSSFQVKSLEDYEKLKKVNLARSSTKSKYIRKNLIDNVREHSNGESAFLYFGSKITDHALYLLDEPENSLSPDKQQELLRFLEDSARFFHCQFVIATHSPFLLSMKGAKIYDFDEDPADVKKWTELSSMRQYYAFFKKHVGEFEGGIP